MDPIYEEDGEWWFWTETWDSLEGPFNSKQECRQALREYAEEL